MIDPNWTRWLVASVHKHAMAAFPEDLFIEGVGGWNKTVLNARRRELRFTGPSYHQYAPGCYFAYIYVSFLLTDTIEESPMALQTDVGLTQSLLSEDWPVYKIGSATDTQELFGWLGYDPKFGDIETYQMSQIGESVNLQQVIVEKRMRIEIAAGISPTCP